MRPAAKKFIIARITQATRSAMWPLQISVSVACWAKCSSISAQSRVAKTIAAAQGKELKYEMVDFHSSRPGHDLRYSLSGEKMKNLGWQPSIRLTERIKQVVDWSLNNQNWIEL